MTLARYAWGVVSLLVVAGALGVAATRLRRHWFPTWTGALATLAAITIWLALLTGESELLGAVGVFRLGPLIAVSIFIGLITTKALSGERAEPARAARALGWLAGGRYTAAISLIAIAAVTAEWAGPTLDAYDHGIKTFDSLWYHLPWSASFAQTGHILPLRFTDVEYLTAFYPATSELLHGVGIVLLGRDTLSPWANLVWLGLVLLAAYCVGRPRGLGAGTLLGAALAMALPMVRTSQAGSAANDVVGIFFLLASLAFVLADPDDSDGRAPTAIAAVACGLAIAVKLSMLAPALALALGALALAPRRRRLARGWVWLACLVVAGGFWYARNLFAVGNPLPWVNIPGLATPAAPLQAHTGFSVAHYLGSAHFWSSVFVAGVHSGLGGIWPAIIALAIAGPLLCLLTGARRERIIGAVALISLLVYLVTPESAAGPAGNPAGFAFNLRYAAPGLTLCLTALPLAPPLRRIPAIVSGLLGVALALTLARAGLWPSSHLTGAVAIGVVCALAAAVLAFRPGAAAARSRTRQPLTVARTAVLAIGIAVLGLAAAGAGYAAQRHYLRGRYVFGPGVSSLSGVWAYFRSVHHARVGIVGTFGGFFSYPVYGLELSNRVMYIADRGPNGSFTPIGDCRTWRQAVSASHLRYLVTTPARDPWHPRRLLPSPETHWTASDPSAHLVYRKVAFGQPISVFELTGQLAATDCPA